jgi:hypothetical protein
MKVTLDIPDELRPDYWVLSEDVHCIADGGRCNPSENVFCVTCKKQLTCEYGEARIFRLLVLVEQACIEANNILWEKDNGG